MKKLILAGMVMAMAGCMQSHNGATRYSLLTDPAIFSGHMASELALENAMAQMALHRSKSDEVKSFAQTLLGNNATYERELRPLAQASGVTVPAQLSDGDQAKLRALGQVARDEFDRIYMDTTVDAQRDLYRDLDIAANAPSAALAQFAQTARPTVRTQVEEAERIDVLVGGGLGPTSAHH